MSQAIKISKPGFDVATAKDNQLIFNSDFPLFKIHKQGSNKIRVNGSTQASFIITHDVGKIPMYLVRGHFMVDGNTKSTYYGRYPVSVYFGLGIYGQIKVIPAIDKITIYWNFPGIASNVFEFEYYIFEDPIIL